MAELPPTIAPMVSNFSFPEEFIVSRTLSIAFTVSSSLLPFGIVILTRISLLLESGIKLKPFVNSRTALPTSRTKARRSATSLCERVNLMLFSYNPRSLSINPCLCSLVFRISDCPIAGTSVRATIRLAISEYVIVSARSTNICFVIPSTKTIGRNTQTVVIVDAVIAPATCLAPFTEALMAEYPRLLSLYMFSITTTELSTSIPTPTASPESEIIFIVTPLKYIRTIANTTESGIEKATIKVGLKSLRNSRSTIIANTAPTIRF